jgi:hypothetical protein
MSSVKLLSRIVVVQVCDATGVAKRYVARNIIASSMSLPAKSSHIKLTLGTHREREKLHVHCGP